LRRWKINVRELVRLMEQAVIDLLGEYGVAAQGREDAPGVYSAMQKSPRSAENKATAAATTGWP